VAQMAQLHLPGKATHIIDYFANVDDATRAYDAEVRRRGWVHVRPLNFPQREELGVYPHAGEERCDERGQPLSLAPEPPVSTQGAASTQGVAGPRSPKLSGKKPGKSGFFGVTKNGNNCYKSTPWRAKVSVRGTGGVYDVGFFATKEGAARAYDAEVRRRGWTHIKQLNFLDPAGDAPLPPSSAAAGAPGPD